MKKILFVLATVLLIVSCSKDNPQTQTPEESFSLSKITLTTKAPVNFNLDTAMSGGVASMAINTTTPDYGYGVCYGLNPNPLYEDSATEKKHNTSANSTGDFNSVIDHLIPGKTYYMRAYVKGKSAIKYGNEIMFTVPTVVNTGIVRNITTQSFDVTINVPTNITVNIDKKGVCFSTAPNPTIYNDDIVSPTGGTGIALINFKYSLYGIRLSPNTTYYLRSYIKSNNGINYGNEVTFKTTGYIAGSGGYVFFDKGETTNGWRYLETAPNTYTLSNSYPIWGLNNNFVSNISAEIGTGLENTDLIIQSCNLSNVAARICKIMTINNKKDWFLPSINELAAVHTLQFNGVFILKESKVISSTQVSSNEMNTFNFIDGKVNIENKNDRYVSILPIRRF